MAGNRWLCAGGRFHNLILDGDVDASRTETLLLRTELQYPQQTSWFVYDILSGLT